MLDRRDIVDCLTLLEDYMLDQNTIAAFELVRKHGFVEAQRLAAQWRDMNAPGTSSYCLHNQVCKRLAEFATVGPLHRPVA